MFKLNSIIFLILFYVSTIEAKENCGVYQVYYIPLDREYYIPPKDGDFEKRSICKFIFTSCVLDKVKLDASFLDSNMKNLRIKIKSKTNDNLFYVTSSKEFLINTKIFKPQDNNLTAEIDHIVKLGESCKVR